MALALTGISPRLPPFPRSEGAGPGDPSDLASQRISALGEMTAGLAHDFRTILAVVQSGMSVARRAGADTAKRDLAWAAVDEAVRRGMRLTEELLVFARGGQPDVHTESVNDLLTGSATFMKYGAGPGIRIALDLAPALPECRLDPAQFNAAILNLVVNARDAMPGGGEIRIVTDECRGPCGDIESEVERWVRVRVIDHGCGMPPDVLEHLFEPYFTTKGDAGTGLGVPQVLAFMRATGGSVCVSTEPEVGTSFDLRFPAVEASEAPGDGLSRQLDRWTNEGGSVKPARSGTRPRRGASPNAQRNKQLAGQV
jgi:signal transduction histidine kinase